MFVINLANSKVISPLQMMLKSLLIIFFIVSFFSAACVQATDYIFPGKLPSACSGSNGNYTCSALSLNWADTITIAAPMPATITVNGAMNTNTSNINGSGTASNLTLIVTGALSVGYQTTLQANITAGSISDTSGFVTFGGNLTTTSGNLTLNYLSTVAGSLATTTGTITVGQSDIIGGSVSSTTGAITVGYAAQINGSISTTSGTISLGQSSTVYGSITSASSKIDVGYAAQIFGNVITGSTINLQSFSVASSCVQSTSSAAITLSYFSSVNSVCCGNSCGTSCVVNNSFTTMPPACATSIVQPDIYYHMDETSWSGQQGEVSDSGNYGDDATAQSLSSTTPTTTNTSPAISSNPGTCRYGVFNRNNKDYLALPTNFPNLGASGKAFTITAWIYTTDNTQSGQRILIDDENNTAGYGFSLGDGGIGMLRFFSRGTPSALILDTANLISNNNWYFVAAVIDVPNKTKSLYAFNSAGILLGSASVSWQESSFGSDTGIASIGGETNSAGENNSSFGFAGFIDEVEVLPAALTPGNLQTLLLQTHACSNSSAGITPSNFNCVEVGGTATSNLYTKLASTAFNFDILALTSSGSIDTGYVSGTSKTVKLELVDGSGSTTCANRSVLSSALTQTVSFAASNSGRKTVTINPSNTAYADVRCRITDSNQTPSIVGCSTDDFAIRPSSFSLSSGNANAVYTANNTTSSASATPVISAGSGSGSSFSLTATANASGYTGIPKLDNTLLLAHSGAVQTGVISGSFSNAVASVATAANFSYSEVGYFSLNSDGVYDDSFTLVDSANNKGDCTNDFSNSLVGGKYGCKFANTSQTGFFGRFIPDHFVTSVASNGSFAHSCSSFSYNGQSLSYSTAPMMNVYAYNSSSVTKNYTGAYNRLLASQFVFTPPTSDAQQKGNDNITLLGLNAALASPSLIDNGSGNLSLILGNDSFTYSRENNALIAPFSNAIKIALKSATDLDGVKATTLTTLQPSGETIYYGRVNLQNAIGSELTDLPMTMQTEYYNGSSFVKNTADLCSVATLSISDAVTTDALLPSNTCIWDTNSLSGSAKCSASAPSGESYVEGSSLSSGSFNLYLKAANQVGSLTVSAAVANWLTYNWKGSGASSPTATATFGLYKGNNKQIFFREVY